MLDMKTINGAEVNLMIGRKVVFGDNRSNTKLRMGVIESVRVSHRVYVRVRADDTGWINTRCPSELFLVPSCNGRW